MDTANTANTALVVVAENIGAVPSVVDTANVVAALSRW